MKKSILSVALFVLAAAGVAHADAPAVHPQDLYRFNLSCSFPSSGCSAEARILLNVRDHGPISPDAVKPDWFGNLLSVSCASAGGLISASDATLYRIHDDGYRWAIYNADSTVRVLLQDDPFDGSNHTGIVAALRVDHGFVSGTCDVVASDVH